MRVLITGCAGQVGKEFSALAGGLGQVRGIKRSTCDLSDEAAARAHVRAFRPDVIVNAAAYTAVDKAETDREMCFRVNAVLPRVLAEEAAEVSALLVHYSTDYVFDGSKAGAYIESDPTAPLGVYGETKLAGEQAVMESGAMSVVLRTSWVYSSHGRNFLLTMLRLAKEKPELRVVSDQFGAPTAAGEIAKATLRLVERWAGQKEAFPTGLYHMTAAGKTSWFGFAEAIVGAAKFAPKARVTPISSAEYPTPACRPKNSILSNRKFSETFGFQLSDWTEQLEGVLSQLDLS